jgi:dTDP-4-dehydrorhamnose 3,5-epimerase
MKILSVTPLALPEVKLIRFGRYADPRGYFTEVFRRSDFQTHAELSFFGPVEFVQCNESFSQPRVMRGLHFQWEPPVGKLVRTVSGRMVDLVMDIRKGSPNFGKILACDMPTGPGLDYDQWIWVPVGFAHGNFFPEPTKIEYQCTGEYNPRCEAGISPLAPDLDWSLCDPELKRLFDQIAPLANLSDKDRKGLTLQQWTDDPRSGCFVYGGG